MKKSVKFVLSGVIMQEASRQMNLVGQGSAIYTASDTISTL